MSTKYTFVPEKFAFSILQNCFPSSSVDENIVCPRALYTFIDAFLSSAFGNEAHRLSKHLYVSNVVTSSTLSVLQQLVQQ